MTDFSHLQKLDVATADAVDFELFQLEGEPVLKVRPATEANKPYFNAVLRRSSRTQRALTARNMNAGTVAANRREDRELYAAHIVCGWSRIVDSEGKDVPYTKEAARDFLAALPDWIFDDLRVFCGNPSNFLEDGVAEAEETGKD